MSNKNELEKGPCVTSYLNGQLFYEGNFKDGNKVGSWVGYHEDGSVNSKFTCFYKDGSMA